MGRITRLVCAVLVLVASLGAGFASAAPVTAPATIAAEGFETTTPTWSYTLAPWDILPSQGSTYGYWGREQRGSGSTWGLWCDGTNGPASIAQYLTYSGGWARFSLETSSFYSSQIAFDYNMPSVGYSDAGSFNLIWAAGDWIPPNGIPRTSNNSFALTPQNGWSHAVFDLSTGSGGLDRHDGVMRFLWVDQMEGYLQNPQTGQGPTVDNVTLTGWRYGPVRSLAATAGSGVVLSWARPFRSSLATTQTEERAIGYHVWRSPAGANSWTELSAAGLSAPLDALTVTYTDPALAPGAYDYAVQPSEAGTSPVGYGSPRYVTATVLPPAVPPIVAVSSPTSGTVLGPLPGTMSGTAQAAPGSVLTGVRVSIQSDGQYWNGSSWQLAATTVAASSSNGFASWSAPLPLSWPAVSSKPGGARHVVTVTAVSRDDHALDSSPAAATFTVDDQPPVVARARLVRAGTAKRYLTVDVVFSEPLADPASVRFRLFDPDTSFIAGRLSLSLPWVTFDATGTRARVVFQGVPTPSGKFKLVVDGATDVRGNAAGTISRIVR